MSPSPDRTRQMTTERRLARAEFTLTRDYPAPVERVWGAFADEGQKLQRGGAGDAMEPGEWAFDFRVGGLWAAGRRGVCRACCGGGRLNTPGGTFHNGPVSRYAGPALFIVERLRI